jgi:hypothetical protein
MRKGIIHARNPPTGLFPSDPPYGLVPDFYQSRMVTAGRC